MIIDANVYWFPELLFREEDLMQQFLADIVKNKDMAAYVKTDKGKSQVVIEKPVGYPSVNYVQGEYNLDFMLSALREAKIDKAVMKVPCCQEWINLEMCRLFNNGMADYQKRSDGKLIALAVLPPFGSEESLGELDRCINHLGMHGIQLSAHYDGKYLDNDIFTSLFEKLNENEMTVYVHHTPLPVQYDPLCQYDNLRRTYGRCVDQMTAVSRELLSGMFRKYPNIKLVHSMLGGGFFTYINMLLPPRLNDTAKRFDTIDGQVCVWLEKNIFFEMSHAQPWGSPQLECAIKTMGADHIIYGSSFPVRQEWLSDGPNFVMALNISEEDKVKILSENAAKLYNIK